MNTNHELIWQTLFQLELYLIEKNNFMLNGIDYDLIMFTPQSEYQSKTSYILKVSSKAFDSRTEKEIITDIFDRFYANLPTDLLRQINSVQVLSTNSKFVENIKFSIPKAFFPLTMTKLPELWIDDTLIEQVYLVRSKLLPNLKLGKAVDINTKDGQSKTGLIYAIDKDFRLLFFTREYVLENKSKFSLENNLGSMHKLALVNDTMFKNEGQIDSIFLSEIDFIEEDQQLTLLLESA